MDLHGLTPILNVTSVPESMAWFEKFGWSRTFTWNGGGMIKDAADENDQGVADFGGIENGKCKIFLCCGAQGSRGGPAPKHYGDDDTGGVWMSWWLGSPAEVDEAHGIAIKNGFNVAWPPTDEAWGVRECRIVHPDGHKFRMSAGLADE
jgi:Glyoxalase/Bleomycin resistance protein/Dioxygenase superfamily